MSSYPLITAVSNKKNLRVACGGLRQAARARHGRPRSSRARHGCPRSCSRGHPHSSRPGRRWPNSLQSGWSSSACSLRQPERSPPAHISRSAAKASEHGKRRERERSLMWSRSTFGWRGSYVDVQNGLQT